jgi:hypothetical protein
MMGMHTQDDLDRMLTRLKLTGKRRPGPIDYADF